MIQAAIIGISGFGNEHYRDLLREVELGKVRLAAATVINQSEEAEKCAYLRSLGCTLFEDYQEMLSTMEGRLDLCVIPTGIPLHAPMTLAALGAGCNVLLEKPAAGTIQEVTAMQEAEAAAQRFVAVAYQSLYAPELMRLKQSLLDGLIGRVKAIKCRGLWPRTNLYYERNGWAGRLKQLDRWVLDSPFNNAFAHWLNMLCFLAGSEPREAAHPISMQAELYRARPIESADTACMRIDTEEGIPLLLWVTHSCPKNEDPILEVRGETGSLIWTQQGIQHWPDGRKAESWPTHTVEQFRDLMYDAVLRKIAGADEFICGLDIARQQTLCANGAFESSDIHSLPMDYLSRYREGTNQIVTIDGIAETCRNAFLQEKLWSEMGLPWAQEGRMISLREYPGFGLSKDSSLSIPAVG